MSPLHSSLTLSVSLCLSLALVASPPTRTEYLSEVCTWRGPAGTRRIPAWQKLSPCRWSVPFPPSTSNLWKTARRWPRVSCWRPPHSLPVLLPVLYSFSFSSVLLGRSLASLSHLCVLCVCVQVCTCVRVTTSRCVRAKETEHLLWSVQNSNLELRLQITGSRGGRLFS